MIQQEPKTQRLAPAFHRNGISLVEVVVSTLLVSTVLVTSIQTLTSTAMIRSAATHHSHAPELANLLMVEILECRYRDPEGGASMGPDPSETRASYDDVDDYHGMTNSPPTDRSGAPIAGASGWTQTVQITHCVPNTLVESSVETGLKRVLITTTSPQGRSFILESLRGEYGMFETETTAPRIVAGSLRFNITDTYGDSATSATLMPTYAESP